jgi:hypothetical protein
MKKVLDKNAAKEELKAARLQLKEFRHDVAILKRKGVLSNKYDARSVSPTKYLKSIIKQFSDVAEGKATTVKVSKTNKKYYQEKGFKTVNGRVVVKIKPNEKVISSHGNYSIQQTIGSLKITRRDLLINRTDIATALFDLKTSKIKLKKNEAAAFQFYGNNSRKIYVDLQGQTAWEQMAEDLSHYRTIETAQNKSHEQQEELIEAIFIYSTVADENGEFKKLEQTPEAKERAQLMSEYNKKVKKVKGKIYRETREKHSKK